MSSCFQLSRFREIGKKIVGLARTYRFVDLLKRATLLNLPNNVIS